MASKVLNGATANTTSDPINMNDRTASFYRLTCLVNGELDGAIVRVALSPDGSDGSFQVLASSTVEPSTGPLNIDLASGFQAALVLTDASTSTSVDGYVGLGVSR